MENSFFNAYPYTDFHELNLSWVVRELRSFATTLEQFVSINALKYADPIQWNITSQYEKNTIVIDPVTGVAYISVAPVPAGVIITNTDYWTPVFDLGALTEKAGRNIANKYEENTTLTATFPSNVNDWLIWGDVLYRVISPIIAGDQYVVGSNIEHFTLEDIIGHLEDLNTTDKSSLVSAINEVLTTLANTTGDLDDLDTTDKSNLVASINEVLQTLFDTTGDLDDLNTTDKSNLVGAINEINSSLNEYKTNNRYINALVAGAKGDGVTDDTAILQSILDSGNNLYLPSGTYIISDSLQLRNQIVSGAGSETVIVQTSTNDIIKMGSRSFLRDIKIQFADSINIASATGYDKLVGISVKSDLTPYDFQRSGIDHVLITHVGNGYSDYNGTAFSIKLSNVEITDFSITGISMQYGLNSGNILSNVYVNNGVIDPGTVNADLKRAWQGIILSNQEHVVFDNVNVEWGIYDQAVTAINSNIVGSSLHIEEVALSTIYNATISLDHSNLVLDTVEIYYPWLYVEGSSLFVLVNGGRYTLNERYLDESIVHIGTFYIEGLNSPDPTMFPAKQRGLDYAGANYNMFLRGGANTGKFIVHVDNYNYTNFYSNDEAWYSNYHEYTNVIVEKFGYLPLSGLLSDRPTLRVCDGTKYYATDAETEYTYHNGTWYATSCGSHQTTLTPDSNFNMQSSIFNLYNFNNSIDVFLQGTITTIGNIGTLSDAIDFDLPFSINDQIFTLHCSSGTVSIVNSVGYDPADLPANYWFRARITGLYFA